MAQVTAQMVKELRERTQAGMSDCKSALVEAAGEMEKAVELILKKGLAKSAKRAGAVAAEGEVSAYVAPDNKSAVLIEVNIQTDFAARNEHFTKFVQHVVAIAAGCPAGDNLLEQPYPSTGGKTVEEVRKELAATIGENIQIRRWERIDVTSPGLIQSYVHLGGKIGVLVEVGTETPDAAGKPLIKKFAEDVAMQIAAMAPLYAERTQVPTSSVDKQIEIYTAQLKEEKKPEAAWSKILEGKKNKWLSEVCLLEQERVFLLEGEAAVPSGATVDQARREVSKQVGGTVSVRRFVRYERGEGIEKKTDDFASEVAKLAGT